MLRSQSESAQSESGLAIHHTGTMDIQDTAMAITRGATTAITGVTHLTEQVTTVAGLTMAIGITSITNVTITTTKRMD